ncbi:hypothetical protein B0A55_01225 [Friedmanniomyces simplex]|uniref:Mif2/CENP-C cupin domain-containing protein n=1 Tax=Friedmanniomyces simplex TaxID=329884 RepID=A0A4U0XZR2_9PEZI|nr:hypothetical protein B0A55_01225 [Friedmanniomyces simplex]
MRRTTQNQYFDVGKVGRKTGVTLPDKGIRDEHGMEPMSGIFDSPIKSPQRNSDRTLASSDMHVQESSAPDVNETLYLSKTPRLPPPRAGTPKHTNIGSPKRMSTGKKTQEQQPHTTGKAQLPRDEDDRSPGKAISRTQPPANRVLDFSKDTEKVRRSIEITSPFKPKRALRRSMQRQNPFASPIAEVGRKPRAESVAEALRTVDETVLLLSTDDAPVMVDDDPVAPVLDVDGSEVDASLESIGALPAAELKELKRSLNGLTGRSTGSRSPSVLERTPSKKRDRTSFESGDADVDATASQAQSDDHASVSPEPKKARSGPRVSETTVLQEEDQPMTVDPSLLSQSGESLVEHQHEPSMPPPKKTTKGKAKPKALQDRDPNRASKAPGSPVKLKEAPEKSSKSPSKRAGSRGLSVGPNFNLRATTPFDDAISTSRFGRPVIKPLQYWANESRIWKNGECEGIIRADEIVQPRPKPKKKSKKRKTMSKLDDINEESETESTMADEWEEDLGVISGTVANWDPATQSGNSSDPIKEDLAFAQPSITTRDVAGSEFKYAKITTLPFFGAGLVELPPKGFKRAKNSRKMQMVFFVHEGKVLVEIGAQGMPPGAGGGEGGSVNAFAISKGGVWVVPRGNNYAITNESRTKTAKVFFAQGCEVDAFAGAAQ